jgi:2-amino-4-hydroxy-6-hydroxymethyldihydropteridine diphosphokinase
MQREPVTAFVALGANLGDAQQAVLQAITLLACLPETELTARSRLYRTAPYEASGPDFVNAVVSLATRLTAPDLLQALQNLELQAGRLRPYMHAPRTLDLDVLLYGDAHIDSPRLIVPHPRMWGRAFVLQPLAELAPERIPPGGLAAVSDQAISPLAEIGVS